MADDDNYWVSKRDAGWAVKREGSSRATSIHQNQSAAWNEARRLARGAGGEAVLKGENGQIRARNTYGRDPNPPKG